MVENGSTAKLHAAAPSPSSGSKSTDESQGQLSQLLAGIKRSRAEVAENNADKPRATSAPPPRRPPSGGIGTYAGKAEAGVLPSAGDQTAREPRPGDVLTSPAVNATAAAAAAGSSGKASSADDSSPSHPPITPGPATPPQHGKKIHETAAAPAAVAPARQEAREQSAGVPLSQGLGWICMDANVNNLLAYIGVPGVRYVDVPSSADLAADMKRGNDERDVFDNTTSTLFVNLKDNEVVRGMFAVSAENFVKITNSLTNSFRSGDACWKLKEERVEEKVRFADKEEDIRVRTVKTKTTPGGAAQETRRIQPVAGKMLTGTSTDGAIVWFQRLRVLDDPTTENALADHRCPIPRWFERTDVRQFLYASQHLSFWFRLEKTMPDRRRENIRSSTEQEFRVIVETACPTQATTCPDRTGKSLVAKITDLLQMTMGTKQRPSLTIQEALPST